MTADTASGIQTVDLAREAERLRRGLQALDRTLGDAVTNKSSRANLLLSASIAHQRVKAELERARALEAAVKGGAS